MCLRDAMPPAAGFLGASAPRLPSCVCALLRFAALGVLFALDFPALPSSLTPTTAPYPCNQLSQRGAW